MTSFYLVKAYNFLKLVSWMLAFVLAKNRFPPLTKGNFQKFICDCEFVTSQTPYDTHPEVVINHAKFRVCKQGSFGEVIIDKLNRAS